MRCRYCGNTIDEYTDVCPRCGVDLTPAARAHRRRVSVLYAGIACLAMAALLYVVLQWYASQLPV